MAFGFVGLITALRRSKSGTPSVLTIPAFVAPTFVAWLYVFYQYMP